MNRLPKIALAKLLAMIFFAMGIGSNLWAFDVRMGAPLLLPGSCVRPGKVAVATVLLTNTDSQPAEGFLDVMLEGFAQQKYSHPFRLEPQSQKLLTVPILIPSTVKRGSQIEAKLLLEMLVNGERIASVQAGERVFSTMPLLVEPDLNVTLGLFGKVPRDPLSWEWRRDRRNYLYEITLAARLQNGLTRRLMNIHDEPLPLEPSLWDAIDTVILANDIYFEDSSNIAALQSWVMRGGRLWVMLDQIQSSKLGALLGPHVYCQTEDDVYLNELQIRTTDPINLSDNDLKYAVQPPALMRRVRMEGVEVTHWVHEWPAVAWAKLGLGEICLTTLEARAWLRPTETALTQSQFDAMAKEAAEAAGVEVAPTERRAVAGRNPDRSSDFQLKSWVGNMPQRLFYEKLPSKVDPIVDAAVSDQIGLPVINKVWVFSLMSGFLLLLTVALVWLGRLRRLESIGWLAPVVSLIFAVPLIISTSLTRRELKAQLSSLQFVDASTGMGRAQVDESVAVYQPTAGPLHFLSLGGGELAPSQPILNRIPMLIERKDFGVWDWSAEQWPAGIWNVRQRFESLQPMRQLQGRVTERGLELSWQSNANELSLPRFDDVLLYWPRGNPVIARADGEGRWLATAEDGVDGGSWVTGTLLDDKQLLHQRIYAGLLGQSEPFPAHAPMVFGWSDLLQTSLDTQPRVPKSGEALWSVPLQLTPPSKGQRLAIPGWMLQVQPTQVGSSFFDNKSGKWAKKSFSNTAVVDLRFTLPASLIPSRVSAAKLKMRLLLPQRQLKISQLVNRSPIPIATLSSPTSQIEVDLAGDGVQQAIAQGALELRFEITDRDDSAADSSGNGRSGTWQIDTMALDIEGTK